MDNARAFLGKRVVVDSELILAYAEKSGNDPLRVGHMFGARLVRERDTCHMEYVTRLFGYKCSACGGVTRSSGGEKFLFCPRCGAEVIA